MEDNLNFLKMEDNLMFWKWKVTSILFSETKEADFWYATLFYPTILNMEDNLNIFRNGRRPQVCPS